MLATAPLRGPGLDRLSAAVDLVLDPWIDHQPLRLYSAADLAARAEAEGATVILCEADEVRGPVLDLPLVAIDPEPEPRPAGFDARQFDDTATGDEIPALERRRQAQRHRRRRMQRRQRETAQQRADAAHPATAPPQHRSSGQRSRDPCHRRQGRQAQARGNPTEQRGGNCEPQGCGIGPAKVGHVHDPASASDGVATVGAARALPWV